MKPLDLDVKDGLRIQPDPLGLLQIFRQFRLLLALYLQKRGKRLRIILVGQQAFQGHGVPAEVPFHIPVQPFYQFPVTVEKPSAEGDAVGLIVEFLRIDIIERFQLRILQDLCVQLRHSVDAAPVVDVHMGHMHPVLLINDGYPGILVSPLRPQVQLPDNGHQLRHYLLQIGNRPFLQRLRQDGMISVSAGLLDDLHRLVEINMALHKQPDQLRDHHGRMGVVDLDRHMLVKPAKLISLLLTFLQDQLRPVGHHEILLIDPQEISRLVAVVRVEEQGQVLLDIMLVKRDPVPDDTLIHPFHIKEMELVPSVLIPGHIDIVQFRSQGKIFKGNLEADACVCKPALWFDPGIGGLLLLVPLEHLLKKPHMIVQSDAVSGKSQSGDGIQETGGKPAQAAVSKGRLRFHLLDSAKRFPVFSQDFRHFLVDPQIDQVVGEQLPDQELRGNIIELPLTCDLWKSFKFFLCIRHQRQIDLFVVRFPDLLVKSVLHDFCQIFSYHSRSSFLDSNKKYRLITCQSVIQRYLSFFVYSVEEAFSSCAIAAFCIGIRQFRLLPNSTITSSSLMSMITP